MSESFSELFQASNASANVRLGSVITGKVIDIGKEFVTVHAGLKSEGAIPVQQFFDEAGQLEINVGDDVEVVVEAVEDGCGFTRLSREKAKRAEAWTRLAKAHEAGETVMGVISGKVKGGFTVEVQNIRAFLPGSLVDVRPVRDPIVLEGKELEFKVIKIDRKRNNVVVSRRSLGETEGDSEREALISALQEGQEAKGVVKNLTDYGAFVDLGGVDGLLHITDMAWKRVKHPSEIVSVGQELLVKVLKFDRDRNRVSLGLKQLGEDPWVDITRRYPLNSRLSGKVTNITDYGCFVEIEEGVEGLVHVSEMDWTNKNIHPSKVVQLGTEVEVMVLDIDEERRRISLGLKQCKSNPWEAFADTHSKNDKVTGKIKSITDFGIFVGLDGGIDGLVHLSDIAWNESGEEAVRDFKKGQEVEAMVLGVDPERERISLGIKQLEIDPCAHFLEVHTKGSVVKGTVQSIEAKKGAVIDLGDGADGYLKISELSRDRVDDVNDVLKEGEEIEAKFMGLDRKTRMILLSIKAKEDQEEQEAMREVNRSDAPGATLGDLLKEQIDGNKDE